MASRELSLRPTPRHRVHRHQRRRRLRAAEGQPVLRLEQRALGVERRAEVRHALGEAEPCQLGRALARGGRIVGMAQPLGITPRELETLEALASGTSNREIAGRLNVSENAVTTHISRVFDKLSARRRTQAVQRANEAGLIP